MDTQPRPAAQPSEAGDGSPDAGPAGAGSAAGSADDDWSAYAAVVRLTAGAVRVGLVRLREIDTAMPQPSAETATQRPVGADWETVGALVVGFAADLPDRVERGVDTIGKTAERFRPLTAPVTFLARISGVVGLSQRAGAAVGNRLQTEIERLVELGRNQAQRGERLVEVAFSDSVDGIIEHIADSESLDELVHDQTMGITTGAVREVRETGAAADNLTETIFRRIVRRPVREAPRPTLERE